jgi:Xaa-Pro aminopeptidase
MPLKSPFTRDEYVDRLNRTVAAMQQDGLDALIAFANKVVPGHVRYLTGYETRHGIDDSSYFVLTPDYGKRLTLITNSSWEPLREMSWVDEIVVTTKYAEVMADLLPPTARCIGIAGYEFLPAPVFEYLRLRFPGAQFTDASLLAYQVRIVKSPAEVEVLRRCAQITQTGGQAFLDLIQEGRREREILAAVEGALRLNGSDEVSFTTQVGAGPKTFAINCYAAEETLKQGDMVMLDCGATYWGYRGDLSRTTVVGKGSREVMQLLEGTAEMYDRCLEAIRPGVPSSDIARAGIAVAKRYGLEDCLYSSPNVQVGFMGHAVGTHYHEPPWIDLTENTLLQENMVIVVEPILRKEGVGGVNIEDAVLVTAKGAERLCTLDTRPWRAAQSS